MSLALLLDEDSQAKYLVNLLQAVGHDVVTVSEVGLEGYPDEEVLNFARQYGRVLLTRNCADFQELHQINPNHAGILAVYQSSDPSKNMRYQSIVKAIDNIENSETAVANQFFALNQWVFY